MKRAWQPGDVAMVTALNRSIEYRAYFDGREWQECGSGSMTLTTPIGIRPLVVVDPETPDIGGLMPGDLRGGIESVLRVTVDDRQWVQIGLRMQAALREFANPTPPKPEEPLGLGAVVEDAKGERWIRWEIPNRHPHPWCVAGCVKANRKYADITAVEVLTEGLAS